MLIGVLCKETKKLRRIIWIKWKEIEIGIDAKLLG